MLLLLALLLQQEPILSQDAKRRMLEAYFDRMTPARPPVFTTREKWDERRVALRKQVLRSLGLDPLPERVALEPHLAATKEYDDYVLERIWYRTFPDVWASGWLYRPKGRKGPFPVVLCPHGHWANGAREGVVQARCIALAKKGYVAFAIDSVHETLWPVGLCPVGLMTWNNMRALDYLATRAEADMSRVGCTGESGGGQQTMYLMAVEDRIHAAVPVVMITYFRRILFPNEQAHCWCNHVPGIARVTDEPEMTSLFAPRPALYISTSKDWTGPFPKEEFPAILAIYEKLGAGDRVENRHHDVEHDYNRAMREQMYDFFNRHLKGSDDGKEPALKTEPPEELLKMGAPPRGHKGGAGVHAYYLKSFTFKKPPSREDVLTLLGETHVEESKEKAVVLKDGRLMYPSEASISIPARLYGAGKRGVIVLGRDDAFVKDLVAKGFVVLSPDVRFFGELRHNWHLNAVIWGRPEAGMGAHDVKRAVDYLESLDVKSVACVGLGEAGVVALLAAVVDPRLRAVAADDFGPTYKDGRSQPVIPNILRVGDLPQIATLAKGQLRLNRAKGLQEHQEEPEKARKAIAEWLDLLLEK